jgi:hypothetical protein
LRVGYRVRQFLTALGTRASPVSDEELLVYLSKGQATLFRRMAATEQQHAYAVLQACRADGRNQPELMQAALLHDVGKTLGPVTIWHRVTMVVLDFLRPALLLRLADRDKAVYVLLRHAQLGADLAAAVDTGPLACALIREHHSCLESSSLSLDVRPLLTVLQSADERS